uniref:glucuronosyltransferase n=1 Tax=Gongylonema pulchrum TaxID=637853 RepID=A0A183DGT3_9BILA
LTGEFVDLVNDPNSRGTILLAFGTILDWKEAPAERREAFAIALNKLPDYRIIWACRRCPAMNLGRHIRLLDWVPQQEILSHPRTKLFITHGGLKR